MKRWVSRALSVCAALQLLYAQAPLPFQMPDSSMRAVAGSNKIKAELKFGYLREDKSAESLRRRIEFNREGQIIKIVDFGHSGEIQFFGEYAYFPKTNKVSYAQLEEYEDSAALKAARSYRFDLSGNLLEYTSTDALGYQRKSGYTYDERQRLLSVQHFEADGLPGGQDNHAYDDNGNCILIEHRDLAGDVVTSTTFEYDRTGKVTVEAHHLGENFLLYRLSCRYDKSGRLVRREKYGHSGKSAGWETWSYEQSGQVQEHKTQEPGESGQFKELFRYDKAGRLTETMSFESDGQLFQWFRFSYDSTGTGAGFERLNQEGKSEMTDLSGYDGYGRLIWHRHHYGDPGGTIEEQYRYDDAGLLLEEKHLDSEGESAVFWFVYQRY